VLWLSLESSAEQYTCAPSMISNLKLRIPSDVTALKWLFCFLTAALLSVVAFTMGLATSTLYFIREHLVALVAYDKSLMMAYVIYGAYNTSCAGLAAVCVLYGSSSASGSGLPVRACRFANCAMFEAYVAALIATHSRLKIPNTQS
jgi:hypothetical protein